jgi:hypothetical protein
MRNFTFILLVLFASVSFAQNAPVNFESDGYGADWTWTVFENDTNPALEIIANPDASGINTSDSVAKFTALQTGAAWAGVESAHGTTDLGPFVLNATNSTIKIMVWKSVISDVGIKLVANSGWAQVELKVANTLVDEWEELSFDFSDYPNPPEAEGQYDQIVIFPDFNLDGRGQTNIAYFDNITFNPSEGIADEPSAAAPAPPARAAEDVISVFSNAYTNVAGTDFNPGWGQSTVVSTVEIEGNHTLKYANLNYQGTQFASALDVSGMDKLHVDMWTADATEVNIFCISTGPVETAYSLAVTPNQWVSYDIPLSAFGDVDMADVIQLKVTGNDGSPTIFLDNIYFYKGEGTVVEDGPNAPIDFEADGFGANWTWSVFENDSNPALEIIDNPDASEGNTSAKVAKFTALQTGAAWAGFDSQEGDLGEFYWDETNSIVKIMVWKSVISDVGIKFDGGANPNDWSAGEIKVANTVVNQWEELTFDFSDSPNPPAEIGGLKRIAIFPDFNDREQDNVIYIDNITFNPAEGGPTDGPATAAPTPPARDAENVISVFSNAYTNVEGTDLFPGWGQTTAGSMVEIEGNQTLKYASFNYQGMQFANALDASGMEKLHVDMWTANATAVNIFSISTGPVETAYALPITAGQWVSYDIPLSEFEGVDLADVIQFKFDGGDGTPTIYFDNLYFYKLPTSVSIPVNNEFLVYPNPVKSGTLVHLNAVAKQVDVFDITGKLIQSGMNTSSVETGGMNRGVYLMRIQSEKGKIQINKLIVN